MSEVIDKSMKNADRKEFLPGNKDVFFPAAESIEKLPAWYTDFFSEVKTVVSESRRNAMWIANTSMMMTYYLDEQIVQRSVAQLSWKLKCQKKWRLIELCDERNAGGKYNEFMPTVSAWKN